MFHISMGLPVPEKAKLKKECKKIKAFLVLLKRKLALQQVCRNRNFRRLMHLVYAPDTDYPGYQDTVMDQFMLEFEVVPGL